MASNSSCVPVFEDTSVVDHVDSIGVSRGRYAVGDQQRGLRAAQALEPTQYSVFRLSVDAGEAVVEEQNLGVADQAAGERGALLLAPRKRYATLSHDGAQSFGKVADGRLQAGGFDRVPDGFVLPFGVVVGQVFAQRGREQERILGDQGDDFPQLAYGEVADVVAIQEHAALGRVEQANGGFQDRGLARADPSQECDGLPRAHMQVDVADRRPGCAGMPIGELAELDASLDGFHRLEVRVVHHLGLGVEYLVEPFRAGGGSHEHGQRVADGGHRHGDHAQVDGKRRPRADGDVTGKHQHPAVEHDDQGGRSSTWPAWRPP